MHHIELNTPKEIIFYKLCILNSHEINEELSVCFIKLPICIFVYDDDDDKKEKGEHYKKFLFFELREDKIYTTQQT